MSVSKSNRANVVRSEHVHSSKPKAKTTSASKVEASPSVATTQPAAAVAPASTAAPAPPSGSAAPAVTTATLTLNITRAIALVKEAMEIAAIETPVLTGEERRGLLKLRKGGEAQIPQLAEMSAEYGVEVPARPTPDMATNLALANALAPLLTVVGRFLKLIEDATLQYESEAWATAITLYSMLKKASMRQPALKAELASLETFFAYRHPSTVTPAAPSDTTKKAKRAKRTADEEKALAAAQSPAVITDAAAAPAASGTASGTTTHA
jgi:hypothetical protein